MSAGLFGEGSGAAVALWAEHLPLILHAGSMWIHLNHDGYLSQDISFLPSLSCKPLKRKVPSISLVHNLPPPQRTHLVLTLLPLPSCLGTLLVYSFVASTLLVPS